MPPKIILINRMMGYGAQNIMLKGHSGKAYGKLSLYSTEYKCHTVVLTLAEYESAREDIFKKMRSSMSGFGLWEVKVVAQTTEAKPEIPAPPIYRPDGAPGINPFFGGITYGEKTPWNQMVKAAKAAGVKIKKGGSREDLLAAVEALRIEKLTHA